MKIKRIITSLMVVLVVAGASVFATRAFFSDTETSEGNVLAAGSIDLLVDNESYVTNNEGDLVASENTSWQLSNLDDGGGPADGRYLFFNFDDLKPGDFGEDTISLHVDDNDSYACMTVDITSTPENGIVDPEADAGDVTDGENGGELQNYLNFAFWADDGDNVYEDDEEIFWEGQAGEMFDGSWQTLADTENNVWSEGNAPLPGDETVYVAKAWCFGSLAENPVGQDDAGKTEGSVNGPLERGTGFNCLGAGEGNQNDAQTDSIVSDVSFYAVQSRNNDEFVCSSLDTEFVFDSHDGEHDDNQANDEPYVTWEINGDEIDFTFHNPTSITSPFPFEYRIDDEPGNPISGITGETIPSGPYAGDVWGDFYNFVSVGPGDSTTMTLTGESKIQVRLVIGPERDYDFDWITFVAN